jgi:hypothetical protein
MRIVFCHRLTHRRTHLCYPTQGIVFKIDLMTPQIINKIYIVSTVERRVFLRVSCLHIQMLAQTFNKLSIQEQ